jgi:hypothetical protein
METNVKEIRLPPFIPCVYSPSSALAEDRTVNSKTPLPAILSPSKDQLPENNHGSR